MEVESIPQTKQNVQTPSLNKLSKQQASRLLRLKGGIIVSCQAAKGEPFFGHMHLFAKSAKRGGAIGIRGDYPELTQLKKVGLVLIGIYKKKVKGQVIITPSIQEIKKLLIADIIAFDATKRKTDDEVKAMIDAIHHHHKLAMADIATADEGLRAWNLGADLVATTLSGYTPWSKQQQEPDLALVATLASHQVRVIAEGRIATPAQAAQAITAGAYAVVVGSAITRPILLTQAFVHAATTAAQQHRQSKKKEQGKDKNKWPKNKEELQNGNNNIVQHNSTTA
ncbi:MAG: putative N-acetylmannosamine-6-phosphate 2-epimerase [Candidatus Woesearchaeota archaeon]